MTTYVLQQHTTTWRIDGVEHSETRECIHPVLLAGWKQVQTVDAPSWIDAKKALGYELTPLQEVMRLERKVA